MGIPLSAVEVTHDSSRRRVVDDVDEAHEVQECPTSLALPALDISVECAR